MFRVVIPGYLVDDLRKKNRTQSVTHVQHSISQVIFIINLSVFIWCINSVFSMDVIFILLKDPQICPF